MNTLSHYLEIKGEPLLCSHTRGLCVLVSSYPWKIRWWKNRTALAVEKFFPALKIIDMFWQYFQFSFWSMRKYPISVRAFLYEALDRLRNGSVYSGLSEKQMWFTSESIQLRYFLLRANSAAHLETLQNRFYNWILQETLTIGIVHNMLKW